MVRSLFLLALGAIPITVSTIEVTLNSGTIVGRTVSGVDRFLGVPYAQPPTNDLRFRPPQPLNASLTIFETPEIAPACMQNPTTFNRPPNNASSTLPGLKMPYLAPVLLETEDCLTIDIVRPATSNTTASPSGLLPVFFWIFGGGFQSGATHQYPGDKIVRFSVDAGEPILFVAPNYRLGVFGFMPGQEIRNEGSSNVGLKDQRLALQWVQDNIERFGGDPARVTIAGESAGAHATMYQTIINHGNNSYKGKPLFRGAIQNSGAIFPVQGIASATAQDTFNRVVNLSNCRNSTAPLSCLRTLNATELQSAAAANPGAPSYQGLTTSYKPRPDDQDSFLPDSSEVAFAGRAFSNVSYIIGTMEDEGTFFFASGPDNLTTLSQLPDYIAASFPALSRAAIVDFINTYDLSPTAGSPFNTGDSWQLYPVFKQLSAIYADLFFQFTSRRQRELVSSSVPTWGYQMSSYPDTPWFGTWHGSDLYALFANFTLNKFAEDSQTRFVVNFVNHLDPNGSPASNRAPSRNACTTFWPQYTATERSLLQYLPSTNEVVTDGFRQSSYDYWLTLYGALRS